MCKLFLGLDPKSYTFQIRSVRLGGHATSIRLEDMFWCVLEKLAAEEGTTLGRFLTKLHDEILKFHGEANNFTSLLRCACLVHIESTKDAADSKAAVPLHMWRAESTSIKPEVSRAQLSAPARVR